jgi:hypothetical protein
MTIDTRAREEAHRAHQEVAAIEVPNFEAVIGRRRARRNARLVMASAAVVVVVAIMSGVAAVATRDGGPTVAVSPSPPTAPVRAGLSFQSFHLQACNFAGIDGCTLVPDSGTSSDIASAVVVRNQGRAGSVIELTLTPAAAQRFAKDTIYTASLDGVPVNAAMGENRRLVLSRAGTTQWSEQAANAVAARILATR